MSDESIEPYEDIVKMYVFDDLKHHLIGFDMVRAIIDLSAKKVRVQQVVSIKALGHLLAEEVAETKKNFNLALELANQGKLYWRYFGRILKVEFDNKDLIHLAAETEHIQRVPPKYGKVVADENISLKELEAISEKAIEDAK